ncbi:hypothetical protein ACE6H2_002676 [Prunus campanulata]
MAVLLLGLDNSSRSSAQIADSTKISKASSTTFRCWMTVVSSGFHKSELSFFCDVDGELTKKARWRSVIEPQATSKTKSDLTKKARWRSVIEPQATTKTRYDVLGFSHLARSLDLFSRTLSSLTVNMASMAPGDD